MTNLKQSLPRRIISLLLAVAMMIGFVPHINLDLTAFAETGGIELDDAKPQSGANWVWDNTTHTLSLYNASIEPSSAYYAFKYAGTSTLKINQIGYNLIGNSYIEADKIEVVGSGILDIQNWSSDRQMFKTKELTLSNGYITSSGTLADAATKLVCYKDSSGDNLVKNVTISNCVLDIPNTTITAQTTTTTTAFIMNSGYVRCATFETKLGETNKTASINGGYLEANTIYGDGNSTDGYAYIYLEDSNAIIKADTLGANTSFWVVDDVDYSALGNAILIYATDNRGLTYGGLCASEETSNTDSAGYTVRMRTGTSSKYIPLGETVPTSFSEDAAYYFNSSATIEKANREDIDIPAGATVVCKGELTLNNVTVYGSSDTSYGATVYADEIKSNLSGIYGCVICENAELSNQTEIRVPGGLYLTGFLALNDDTTIGANAAVTMYSKASTGNILNCSNNTLNILGDFSIKKSDSNTGTIFNETEKNIVLGSDGQLAAVGSWSATGSNTIFYPLEGNPYNTIVNSALANNRYVYTAGQIYDDMDCNYLFEKPNVIYIGNEYKPQIARTKTDIYNHDKENIVFQKSLGDEAHFEFICSREITADDISVKVLGGTYDKTDEFTIEKEVSSSNSRIVTVKLKLNEDLDYNAYSSLDVKVALNNSGAELYSTIAQLAVTPLNFALDFTLDEDDTRWDYFGEFLGTPTLLTYQ